MKYRLLIIGGIVLLLVIVIVGESTGVPSDNSVHVREHLQAMARAYKKPSRTYFMVLAD